jgi:hypothetical protein
MARRLLMNGALELGDENLMKGMEGKSLLRITCRLQWPDSKRRVRQDY